MRILVVGTHPHVRQPSMTLFAQWLAEAASGLGHVTCVNAPPLFLNTVHRDKAVAKWLAYIDQYIVLTLWLWVTSRRYDIIVVADHGNAPSTLLVQRRKVVVMVHDTIAMRQALHLVPEAPPLTRTGVFLQSLIRHAVRRATALLSNPGAVPEQIGALGLGDKVFVVGCPVDERRLPHPASSPDIEAPYILNVGGDGWRKRKLSLIPLWRAVQARSNLKLVLAGQTDGSTREAFQRNGIEPIIFNQVTDAELASLYMNCAGFISSSHEEGLCIPVLEALHFKKPVFLPDVSPSYADFFGKAAIRIPFNIPETGAEYLLEGLTAETAAVAITQILEWSKRSAYDDRIRAALASAAH